MAVICAVAALRPRPPMVILDAPQDGPAEVVPEIASYEPPPPPAGADFELVSVEQPAPPPSSFGEPYDIVVRLPRGDTPADVLDEIGIADDDRVAAVTALDHLLKKRRLAVGKS